LPKVHRGLPRKAGADRGGAEPHAVAHDFGHLYARVDRRLWGEKWVCVCVGGGGGGGGTTHKHKSSIETHGETQKKGSVSKKRNERKAEDG
jgi:hypothetical protein